MICPNCDKDYKDVPAGKPPGYYYRGDDHYYLPFRRFGLQCTNCGFIAEIIAKPTGEPYLKRENKDRDIKTIDMFEQEKKP